MEADFQLSSQASLPYPPATSAEVSRLSFCFISRSSLLDPDLPEMSARGKSVPIKKGKAGWEDIEIHDSRKMSTLILT